MIHKQKRFSVILPTYNEAQNLQPLLEKIFSYKLDLSVIVVDDNSSDGTGALADSLTEYYPLSVLHRPGKLGLGSAYLEGFRLALDHGAEFVFEMDADFSHDPQYLPKFCAAAERGYQVVIGSRRVAGGSIVGWNLWRHFSSGGAMMASRLLLGLKTHDVTSGFRCYHHKVVETFLRAGIQSGGYSFQEETIYIAERMGFSVKEIPIVFRDRIHGVSKLSKREIWLFFQTLLRLRFSSFRARRAQFDAKK